MGNKAGYMAVSPTFWNVMVVPIPIIGVALAPLIAFWSTWARLRQNEETYGKGKKRGILQGAGAINWR